MQTQSGTTRPYTGPLPKGTFEFPLPKTGINARISAATGKVTSYNVRTESFERDGKAGERETIGGKTLEDLQANWTSWHIRNRDTSKAEGRGELKTLGDFAAWFFPTILAHDVAIGKIAQATLNNRRRSLRLHILHPEYGCGHLRLGHTNKASQKLNLENLEAFVRRMQEANVGPIAIKHAVETLHILGRGLKKHTSKSGLRTDPTIGLEVDADYRPQTDLAPKADYFTDPRRTLALADASATALPAHFGAFWHAVTSLGLRRNELCGAEWDHFEGFDWSKPITNDGWLNVVQQVQYDGEKGEPKQVALVRCKHQRGDATDMRRITVDAEVAEALRLQKKAQTELRLSKANRWGKLSAKQAALPKDQQPVAGNFVFSDDGLCMLPHQMDYLFRKVRKASGVKGMTLHKGRHDMVSILISRGVALDQVQRQARHKRIATTLGYAHKVERADEAAPAMSSFWQQLREQEQAKAV